MLGSLQFPLCVNRVSQWCICIDALTLTTHAEFSIRVSRWPTVTSIFIYVRKCQKAADLFNSIFICYQFIFNIFLWFGDWLFRANPDRENINYSSIYWISECVLSCWGDAAQSGHETTNNFILKYWECTTYFHFPFVGNFSISLCRCVHIGFVLLSSEEFYSIFMFFLFLFLSITSNARKCCVHVIYAVSDGRGRGRRRREKRKYCTTDNVLSCS